MVTWTELSDQYIISAAAAEVFAAVHTDFSKAFDCILHGLVIAKLNAFGFDKKSLSIIPAYLYNSKQKLR